MPRSIIGAAFVSLDGVMQAPGGIEEDRSGGFEHGAWLAPVGDEALEQALGVLFDGEFDLLLGRRTYDIFAAYWPYASMDNPIAAKFAECDKFVLTGRDARLDWAGSHRLASVDEIAALRAADGRDLIVQGSSTLYPQLLERGLIDRLVLMIAPVLLGSGKRLFGDGTPPRTLRLVSQVTGSIGMNVATYAPAGPVEHAPAGPEITSDAELARRAEVAKGTW